MKQTTLDRFLAALACFRRFFWRLAWHQDRRGYVPRLNLAKPNHFLIATAVIVVISAGVILAGCL